MRRAVLAVGAMVAGTTLLVSLKSAPGASRLPDQVAADRAAARLAISPTPTPSHVDTSAGPVPATTATPAAAGPGPSTPTGGPASTAGPRPTATTTRPVPAPGRTPTWITGDSSFTEFGYVTVAITVDNGRITDVKTIEMPSNEPRSISISSNAAPILRQRALTAQSAHFDTVTGATWTSDAYKESLQSAIDHAGLG